MGNKIINTQDDFLQSYFHQIKAYPSLSLEEELALSKKIQAGDTAALHRLVNANLRLVVKIAKQYSAVDASFMDFVQEGNLALFHAAQKYDYRKNIRFCTYATWWIRQAVARYTTNKHSIIRLSHGQLKMLRKIRHAYQVLSQTLMYQPQNVDIAEELGIPVQEIDRVINMTSGILPLELRFDEEEDSSGMDVHEDYTYSPEQYLLKKSSRDSAMRILDKLEDQERNIINYRYQLNGCKRQTLREIGNRLNISPESVRQIEMKALKKIRNHAKELKECVYTEAM